MDFSPIAFVAPLVDFIMHIDIHLQVLAADYGVWLYLILFLIVFAETGLVVTPFLPGDSLIFAAGSLASLAGSALDANLLFLVFFSAAVLGDTLNYAIGHKVGPRVFDYEKSFIFNPSHLIKTNHFFEKYGGKTIIIARFVPIVRTFAPFVAGIGAMTYHRFIFFQYFRRSSLGWPVLLQRVLFRPAPLCSGELQAAYSCHHHPLHSSSDC